MELNRLRENEPGDDTEAPASFILGVLGRLQERSEDDFAGESMASEVARLGHGEQTDFSLAAQAFRIRLVERDVLAATVERDRVIATVADAPRQP